jgi:uncharacterized protein
MPTYLTPGVYFETIDQSRATITSIRTDIAAFVGIAERGPLHTPTRLNSWEQFQSVFGTFTPNGYLAYIAKAFFENGGRTCYVVRVAATPGTQVDARVLQPADGSASIVRSVNGFAAGDLVLVRQGGFAQSVHVLRQVDVANRRLQWEVPLEPFFAPDDLERVISFDTGALAARGVLLDENDSPTLRVEASNPGVWGNNLAIRVAHSSLTATRTKNTPQPVDRSASIVESLVGFYTGALVKVFQDQAGIAVKSYRIVKAIDAPRNRLDWDQPLDPAFDLGQPLSFETLEFALTVYEAGKPLEHFSGLSFIKPDDKSSREKTSHYVEDAINEASTLIRVKDLNSLSPFPARLPGLKAGNLKRGLLKLQQGRDGLRALKTHDFTGLIDEESKRGLAALEETDEVSIVAVPDILIQPVPPVQILPRPQPQPDPCLPGQPQPPEAEPPAPPFFEQVPVFTQEQVLAVQQALVAHCELLGDRIALIDPPFFSRASEVVDLSEIQGWRQQFDSKYAALYYPWVLVFDPLRIGGQVVRAIPPGGHVAGIFARTDTLTGVHKAPANEELQWAQGVITDVTAEMQGLLNPVGINAIRIFPGRGLRVFGARTVSSDPSWRYVNVRRLLMMIEEAVEESVQWSVFEPNDFYLRQTLIMALSGFLESLWRRGALAGATAAEAFFVKCDDENNPRSVTDLGQIIVDVGVAPVIPYEFVIFRVGKTEGGLNITE